MNSPKIGKLNIDILITPKGLSINEKNRVQKSHATVPLKVQLHEFSSNFFLFHQKTFHYLDFCIECIHEDKQRFSGLDSFQEKNNYNCLILLKVRAEWFVKNLQI